MGKGSFKLKGVPNMEQEENWIFNGRFYLPNLTNSYVNLQEIETLSQN